jgi:hypothetical protein
MSRQTTKGITGYLKRTHEEPENDNSTDTQQQSNYDKLVADMAKGFMEAQAQMTKPASNNQEMLALLGKMSMQINQMKNSLDNNTDNTNNVSQNSNNSSQQQETITAQNLKDLFGALLQENMNKQNSQQNKDSDSNQTTQNNNKIAVQSAAQVLAQAQYELSNELEASLNKLRQVISKSEKIANKISSLIGNENNKQQ